MLTPWAFDRQVASSNPRAADQGSTCKPASQPAQLNRAPSPPAVATAGPGLYRWILRSVPSLKVIQSSLCKAAMIDDLCRRLLRTRRQEMRALEQGFVGQENQSHQALFHRSRSYSWSIAVVCKTDAAGCQRPSAELLVRRSTPFLAVIGTRTSRLSRNG